MQGICVTLDLDLKHTPKSLDDCPRNWWYISPSFWYFLQGSPVVKRASQKPTGRFERRPTWCRLGALLLVSVPTLVLLPSAAGAASADTGGGAVDVVSEVAASTAGTVAGNPAASPVPSPAASSVEAVKETVDQVSTAAPQVATKTVDQVAKATPQVAANTVDQVAKTVPRVATRAVDQVSKTAPEVVTKSVDRVSEVAPEMTSRTIDETVGGVPAAVDRTVGGVTRVVNRAAAELPAVPVPDPTAGLPTVPGVGKVPILDRPADSGGGPGSPPAPFAGTDAPGGGGGSPAPAGAPAASAVPTPVPPISEAARPGGLELGVEGIRDAAGGVGHEALDRHAATPAATALGAGGGPLTIAASSASSTPSPQSAEHPAPAPERPGPPPLFPAPSSASSGPGGVIFVPFAALIALLALSAPATFSRLREVAGPRAATPFVCALERPG